ncbi:hypothetical protein [Streptosporangium sp. NBC_01756]|uniref:hypothetical protein n=1 Tax=Streptosporangium sp. NBC_01756 TaxID=2975950 RepID=UPI002DDA71D3|nr:hypothetical protein [Streptosporangium sp. NBC_01756]WSC85326.1 hypothetical protein OIE48_33995 [Streptosporangium sp. NBC_01756]
MSVERALDLLAQCVYRFWDDHGTDEIGALLAGARACYDAAEARLRETGSTATRKGTAPWLVP